MDIVAAVIQALKKFHTEAEDVFHELYRRTSDSCSVNETRRKCERRKHRSSLKREDNEIHYRVTIFVLLVEGVLIQLEARFSNHNKKALSSGFFFGRNFQVERVHNRNLKKFSTSLNL